MHLISLRKNFLVMTLWVGFASLFLQTQAFSCCWPWCCCYCGDKPTSTVSVKPRAEDPLINGTSKNYQSSLSQEPLLQQQQASSPSLVLPSVDPYIAAFNGWADTDLSIPCTTNTSTGKLWEGLGLVCGVELTDSPQLNEDIGTKFSKVVKEKWKTFNLQTEAEQYLDRLARFAKPGTTAYVKLFVRTIKNKWAQAPQDFSFAFVESGSSFLFFAKQGRLAVMYIKLPKEGSLTTPLQSRNPTPVIRSTDERKTNTSQKSATTKKDEDE